MNLSSDEKQKLDKAISVTDKVKAGKARKDAIMYIVKLAKEKTGNYPRTLKQALYFLDYLDESVNENMLDKLQRFIYKANALVFPKMTAGKFFLLFMKYNLDINNSEVRAYVEKTLPTKKVKIEFYKLLSKYKDIKEQSVDEQRLDEKMEFDPIDIKTAKPVLMKLFKKVGLVDVQYYKDTKFERDEGHMKLIFKDMKSLMSFKKNDNLYSSKFEKEMYKILNKKGQKWDEQIEATMASLVYSYEDLYLSYIFSTYDWSQDKSESVNEGIKKGDFVKNFSGELGLVNKVSGRTAYVKFPSTGSKSFDTVFVQYLKPSSEKHKGKPVYIEESVNEISWDEMKKIDAIHQQIKKHIEVNHKDSIDYKRDRWMKGYSDLVGHGGKSLNKKNLKNIAKLAKQKNDKTLIKLLSDLSNVSKSVNEVTYADSKGKELKVGGIYLDARGRGKSKKIRIKSADSSGVRYYVFDTGEYMKTPSSVWNNTKAGDYMTFVESVNEAKFTNNITVDSVGAVYNPKTNELTMLVSNYGYDKGETFKLDDDVNTYLIDDLTRSDWNRINTSKKRFGESVDAKSLEKIPTKSEEEQLDEKLITFSNRAPYGQIVFMAGGAGSGKGFAISNFIDSAGFKVRDVDEMKKAVGKLEKLGKISVDKWYKKFSGNLPDGARKHVEEFVIGKGLSIADISDDLKNPNNVAALHFIVDAMGIKDKWLISMLKGKKNKETLPNLLFDITAKKVGSITSVIRPLLANGYDAKNIHLIWVLTDYHVAVMQNKKRARVVPDDILLKTHEGAAKTIWSILTQALPSGLDGRIDVILNNPQNTVFYQDADGNTLRGAVKGFLSLPIKKQGGGLLPEKIWLDKLYRWVSDNGPKTIDLQKPLDMQLESLNEAQKSPAAKMVLQLMDKDPDGGGNYEVALKKALTKFKNVNKAELEKELDLYI